MVYRRSRGYNRKPRGKGRAIRSSRNVGSSSSLTLRTLRGFPDTIRVTLPYAFNYNPIFKSTGPSGQLNGGDLLMMFSGNCYPNIGGPNVTTLQTTGQVTRLEMPLNYMAFAERYGKATCTGSSIQANASYGGTFNVTWSNPIDGVMFSPAMVTFTKAPYDNSESFLGEAPGTFYYNGTLSGSVRPTNPLSVTGNLLSLLQLPIEETISTPNTRFKQLSNPFGSKTVAKFKDTESIRNFCGINNPEDADEFSITTPQKHTDEPIDVGTDLNPKRGFCYVMKAYQLNPALPGAGDSGTHWNVSGRIDYTYEFSQLRPVPQSDWVFGQPAEYADLGDAGDTGMFDPGNGYTGIAWG